MEWNMILPIITAALTFFATVHAQRVQAERERRHHLDDLRLEFQRKALLELQDGIEAVVVTAHTVLSYHERGEPVPPESGNAHLIAGSRIWNLRERVEDHMVRERAQEAIGFGSVLVSAKTYNDAFAMFARINDSCQKTNERIGELFRGALVPPLAPRQSWFHRFWNGLFGRIRRR